MTTNKCMTCGCEDLGNDHHYISDTQKCAYCVTKGQGPCWDGYAYAGTKEKNGKTVPNCIPVKKESGTVNGNSSVNQGRISGGVGWKIEFNTQDCQHGWSVIKVGSGQSIGCFFKEEDAKAALEALAVTEPIVKKDDASGQTKQNEQEGIGSLNFWNGSFAPVMGLQGGGSWKSTYNTPPQKDGTPQVGYGNHSDPKGRSNQ